MLAVMSITAPIFMLIALGYGAVRLRLVPGEALPGMGRFVLFFAMPALIFHTLSELSVHEVIEPGYLLAYAGGSLLLLALGLGLTIRIMKKKAVLGALQSMGMVVPNSAFFGYPVLLQVFGEAPARAFALALLVENLLIIPLALAVLEFSAHREQGASPGRVLRALPARILKNPLILAIMAGALASAIGLTLPAPLVTGLELLGRASAAVALFVIGGSLVGSTLRDKLSDMSLVMLGKLVMHPLLVALMVWWLPPFDPDLQLAVILMAAMPMMSMYPIIGEQYGQRRFAAATLLLTTCAAFVSLSVILLLR
ncbi:AEC family transporter [Oceanimonas marisflavi]|uniref:AEC family transporter n=1 Tax=Oceanimonas marisflavi TaxID=2059724 RepID=UPI000D31543A|nr:AEC family transporter [Oceanimonas marisflavi]